MSQTDKESEQTSDFEEDFKQFRIAFFLGLGAVCGVYVGHCLFTSGAKSLHQISKIFKQ